MYTPSLEACNLEWVFDISGCGRRTLKYRNKGLHLLVIKCCSFMDKRANLGCNSRIGHKTKGDCTSDCTLLQGRCLASLW